MEYIIAKGSACVEAFRELSHAFARTFGYPDRARRSKEVDVGQDLRLLVENLMHEHLHELTPNRPVYFIPKPSAKPSKKAVPVTPQSAIVDVFDIGAEVLHGGKFSEFIRASTWDPALGYPIVDFTGESAEEVLETGTAFDRTDTNPLTVDDMDDVDDGDDHAPRCAGLGSLGGGMEYVEDE